MDIEKIIEKWKKDRLIICPHCGYEHDPAIDSEILIGLITFHGEEEPLEFDCNGCDDRFFVKENVERTFEEKKTMEEFE